MKQLIAMDLGLAVFLAVGWALRDLERAKKIRYLAAAAGVGFLLITLLLGGLTCISMGLGALDAVFYPAFRMSPLSPLALTGYFAYGILAWMPIFLELEEGLKWKYLRSRI